MGSVSVLATISPALCVVCRDSTRGSRGPLCTPCLHGLNHADPVWGDPPPGLADCVSAFDHEGSARALLHAFKFARIETLAPLMAGYMAEHLDPAGPGIAVPVPAVRLRTALRGFDPAAVLAEQVARIAGIRIETRLISRHGLGRQRGGGRRQRLASPPDFRVARRPFLGVRQPDRLNGAPVLLVDDVITTGATVSACAAVLRRIGAGPVTALSFTRRI
jgi:predicted amidophosphoribosyltransferase